MNWWYDAAAAAGVPENDRWGWLVRQSASIDPDKPSFGTRPSSLLVRAPARTNGLVNPYDPAHPLEARARSYLHSNCSSCHVFAGGGNAHIELEYMTAFETKPLDAMKAIGVKPLHSTFDLPDAKLIAAGHPERSVLYERMTRRGPGQMPQLATAIVDEPAVAMIREWIESLEAKADDVSAVSR